MRVALIRPNLGDYRSTDAMPPLAMGIIAARSPGCALTFHDEKVEPVPLNLEADLVAMSVETYTARRAYALADHYRRRGMKVVMGGYHPTFLPDEALAHADAVVTGDAEGAWERLLEDVRQNALQARYAGDNRAPLTDFRIDRSIYRGKKYARIELAQTGRGCRFACDFCSIHAFYGTSLRNRPLEGLLAELDGLSRKRLLFFVDDNLFLDRAHLLALLDAITPLRLRWACQISIDVARDEVLLDRMAAAGCTFALIGFESLENDNLTQMRKGWNRRAGAYSDVARRLHDRGIGIYGTFVFGYDADTPDTVDRAVDFAIESRLEVANFNALTPTPGSALYRRLLDEGRLLSPTWWTDPSWRYGNPIFEPRGMSAESLAEKVHEARRRFYSWQSIALRLVDSEARWSPFRTATTAVANVISRREILKKQHRRLGT